MLLRDWIRAVITFAVMFAIAMPFCLYMKFRRFLNPDWGKEE